MIIFSDSRNLVFNSTDPIQVPKTLLKTLIYFIPYHFHLF